MNYEVNMTCDSNHSSACGDDFTAVRSVDLFRTDRASPQTWSPDVGLSTCGTIYGPRTVKLRCPDTEQELIAFGQSLSDSAQMCHDRVQRVLLEWHDQGGLVANADGCVIDFERILRSGEAGVYDVSGGTIWLDRRTQLLEPDSAFGESARRTWGRMFQKLGRTSTRRVSIANMSRYFWLSVAQSMLD